jgi:DNA replication regulator DPB11
MNIIKDNGAEYCPDLDRTVTHLIAKSPSGRKYEGAATRGVTVVSAEWLYDSVERGMALDEALYDVRIDSTQRGVNAWNRDHVPQKFALGKRTRQDVAEDQPGRRKLRRTISAKLGNARDAIWADIRARPLENPSQNEWHDNNAGFSVGELNKTGDMGHNGNAVKEQNISLVQPVNRTPIVHSKESKGLFSQKVVFIHGFSDSKVSRSNLTLHHSCLTGNSTLF